MDASINESEDERKYVSLNVMRDGDCAAIVRICDALGNATRMEILRYLQRPPFIFSVPELAKALKIPITTLIFHLDKMAAAEIVTVAYKSTKRGAVRLVQRRMKSLGIEFFNTERRECGETAETQAARVGQFSEFFGTAFNFCTATSVFTSFGDNCYVPERFDAELIFTPNGQVAYRFSNQAAKLHKIKRAELSLEICSEAPYFDNEYLSDITFWINDKEITTYVSPGDFGDRRGRLNPEWWPRVNTQYGALITLAVDEKGATINGARVETRARLNDLGLSAGNRVEVRFGNKPTAKNVGGFNLFGKKFGDHPQDVCFTLYYDD